MAAQLHRALEAPALHVQNPRRRARLRALCTGLLLVALATGGLATGGPASAAVPKGLAAYRVRSGDTLTAIAAHFHVTVPQLVRLNHLRNANLLIVGQVLAVPALRPAATPAGVVWTRYRVRAGDTLTAIAARTGSSVATLEAANHVPASGLILVGQVLRVPHGSPGQVRQAIERYAARYHVDPNLVKAVAWQESGFNNRVVSRTGAMGIMQVEPYTAAFVQRSLLGRAANPHTVNGNVELGVALLRFLLDRTGGRTPQAVAGYYQGLTSVRANGMYDDTKRYVHNVLWMRDRFATGRMS